MGIRSAFSPFGGEKLIKKGTVFFKSHWAQSLNIELPKGRYRVVVVGGGGSGAALYDANSNWWGGGSGASGACVIGEFIITAKKIAKITVGYGGAGANGKGASGNYGASSKVLISGVIDVNSNGGGGGYCANWGTAIGGTATQAGLINPQIINGNNGIPGSKGGAVQIGAKSVYGVYGAGSNSGGYSYQTAYGINGYVEIMYLGRK